MPKIFWFDVETTGLDARRHAIVEIGFLIEGIDGRIDEKGHFRIAPRRTDAVDLKALEKCNKTEQEIYTYLHPDFAFNDLIAVLDKHVDRYNRHDKMVQAGYNINFDDDFLRQFFYKAGDKYYGSWFFNARIDVLSVVAEWQAIEHMGLDNFKLETLCKHFEIPLQAHDALEDITATRALYKLLRRNVNDKVNRKGSEEGT